MKIHEIINEGDNLNEASVVKNKKSRSGARYSLRCLNNGKFAVVQTHDNDDNELLFTLGHNPVIVDPGDPYEVEHKFAQL
jgi:hypothetical protein